MSSKPARLRGEDAQILRFAQVLELGEDGAAEFGHEFREVVPRPRVAVAIDEGGDLRKGLQILCDLLTGLRTLYFDRHHAAVAERGAMHLAERRGGDRLGFENRKQLRQLDADLRFDDPFDVGVGERRHIVLQPRERVDIRRRQQISAAGEQLAKLDERGPEPLEVVGQAPGVVGVIADVVGVLLRAAERGTMFQQQGGDSGVPAQLLRQLHGSLRRS